MTPEEMRDLVNNTNAKYCDSFSSSLLDRIEALEKKTEFFIPVPEGE